MVQLASGGDHSFAAVSVDRRTVASIHTSGVTTATGKLAVGKLTKVRAALFFLMLARADRKFSVFTDRAMYTLVNWEYELGKMPSDVEFLWVEELPRNLAEELRSAQTKASDEMLG